MFSLILQGSLIFCNGTIILGKTSFFYSIFPCISKKEVLPVLGVTPEVSGSIQANEAIKFLTEKGNLLEGRFLFWNGFSGNFSEVSLSKLNTCSVCGYLSGINKND